MTKSNSPYHHPLLAILKFIAKKKIRKVSLLCYLPYSVTLSDYARPHAAKTNKNKNEKVYPVYPLFRFQIPVCGKHIKAIFFSGYHRRRRGQFHLLLYFAGASKINSSIRRTSCRKTSVLKGSTREWRTFI